MKRLIPFFVLAALIPLLVARANMLLAPAPAAAPSYTGLGDVVASAEAYYGTRGYSAAYATGSNNALNVRRASDNTTSNIVILSNGNLDTASAATFAGTDATATCSTSGSSVTLSCTSASSTPNSLDPISGAGIVQPAWISSCGTFTGAAGSCTMNAAQTVSSTTVTFQVALFVTEAYDQSGSGKHVLQATTTKQPQLLLTCATLACIRPRATSVLASVGSLSNEPFTESIVMNRTSTTSNNAAFSCGGNGQSGSHAANTAYMYSGVETNATASDNAMHAMQFVFNGVSSSIQADATRTTGLNSGGGTCSAAQLASGFSNDFTGYIYEVGAWSSALSTTNQNNLCHNQFGYWGTSVSC